MLATKPEEPTEHYSQYQADLTRRTNQKIIDRKVVAVVYTYMCYFLQSHTAYYISGLECVRQFFHLIQPTTRAPISVFDAKVKFLCKLLNATEFQQCLIFSNFHNKVYELKFILPSTTAATTNCHGINHNSYPFVFLEKSSYSAQDLCDALCSRGWPVSYISSSLEQGERFRAFNKLRTFQCRVLITTDLVSIILYYFLFSFWYQIVNNRLVMNNSDI
ncbi:unnamed protein product [Schistosoma margrebowiei]|uniref:Uncharacterized protein n=1 Tax=Schistosoma margrebowiei TaxID=48269 RepID=A0A183M9D4_9TREM|nr:unnamed protein product [Schistosoma margrebowiei]